MKSYAEREHITISELLEKVADAIESIEHFPIHQTVQTLTGILHADVQARDAFYQYLSDKHQ